jgi:hypothetical protein
MMEILAAFRDSIRQIHQGLDASGANPKAWVQAMGSVPRLASPCLVDLGRMIPEPFEEPGPMTTAIYAHVAPTQQREKLAEYLK